LGTLLISDGRVNHMNEAIESRRAQQTATLIVNIADSYWIINSLMKRPHVLH
jgi:hypothetical protein